MAVIRRIAVVILLALPAVGAAVPPVPAAHHVTLITDSAPDFTDVASYLASVTAQYSTSQEKAIGVWRWSQRLRKQTGVPEEEGQEVLDPILFFTSYGYTNCGIISGIDNSLWLNLGWQAHYVQLGDHTVSEASWDGGKTWHMFDNSMSFYCFNDAGEVASVREIERTPLYYLERFGPGIGTNPVKGLTDQQGWRAGSDRPVEYQRTLANGMDSFLPPNEINEDHLAIRWGRRYDLTLRPGESYTRWFKALDAGKPDPRYYRPLNGKDVDEASGDRNIRATGVWRYAPDLRDPATRAHVYSESGVRWTTAGIRGPGTVVFKVSAANVVTSPALSLTGTGVSVAVSRDAGIRWTPVTSKAGRVDLLAPVAGVTEYLVQVTLRSGGLLSAISIETLTQLNRPSLPRLVRGPYRVQVRMGPQTETITLAPPLTGGRHRTSISDDRSVDVNPHPYFNVPTLRTRGRGYPCRVTWKVAAPTPITGAEFGGNVSVNADGCRVSLLHSWDGKTFVEDARRTGRILPYDLVVNVPVSDPPANVRAIWFRYVFETPLDTQRWKFAGIASALMTVHHRPRVEGFSPLRVTYDWVEHRTTGDVERTHTERVTSTAYEYTIDVGGFRDPAMKWVRVELAGADAATGYPDGVDVRPGAKAPWARYQWGTNLALGRPYVLAGAQDDRNPDGGADLTDGVIAPPDTYVSAKWMPTNVIFARDVAPVITVDLGGPKTVAGVVVHANQDAGFHLTFPDAIRVETSADGKAFVPAGSAGFNQVFEPPADFVPWELDDSPRFDDLPAGGRLAYGYRILMEKPAMARFIRVTCAPRSGWGIVVSEVEVFDSVRVDRDVPPLVVLPPLGRESR